MEWSVVGYNSNEVSSSLVIISDNGTFVEDGGLEEGPVRVKNPLELLLEGDSRVVVLVLAVDVFNVLEVAVEVFLS